MASLLRTEKSILENKSDLHKELWRIYAQVIQKDKEICAQNAEKVAEISFLSKCAGNNEFSFEVNSISNQILVQLFKKQLIGKDYLLKMLLSFSATARHFTCIVESLIEILAFEMLVEVKNSGSYICPYNIRSPPHPLVTVLQQRPDSFYAITDGIKQKYLEFTREENTAVKHLLLVIKPFVSFVLLDPNRCLSWECLALHTSMIDLLRMLLHFEEKESAYGIAYYLLHVYLCKKNDASTVTETVVMTNQFVECFIDVQVDDQTSSILIQCGYQILCNCQRLLESKLSIKTSLYLLLKLFQKHPTVLLKEESVLLLALLLYQSPSVYREDILILALYVLPCYLKSNSPSAVNVLRSFCLPLLQILFRGSSESEDNRRCQELAKNIFLNIQRAIELYKNCKETVEENENKEHAQNLQLNEIVIAKHHCSLLQLIHRRKSAAIEFLSGLIDTPNPCNSLLILLSTITTSQCDVDVLKKCLQCISTVTRDDPQLAMDFLPLLLHAANNCDSPRITFEIIIFLPSLGKQKHLIAPILKTITMLGSSPSLLPVCIRTATELWKKQPRVFPHVLKLLSTQVDKQNTTCKLQQEIALARSASILDICKLRPAQYGPEVVGLLASIFDEFGRNKDYIGADAADSVVLIGLEAIKALCEAEVVEFTTAWAAISPKIFDKNDSPAIFRGIISLFSICPIVLGRSTAEVNFRNEACNFLWKHIHNENAHVAAASLAALVKFNSDEFRVSHLPNEIQAWTIELLQRKSNSKKRPENSDYDPKNEAIPGPAYIKILQSLQDSAAHGYVLLLSKLFKQEAASLPRNISTANTAKRLGAAYDRFLESIPEFLRSLYEKSKRPALIPGLACGLLCCYKGSVQIGKNEKIGRRHLIEDAKVHRQMLDNCLNEIAIPQMDWYHSLSAPASWCYMMSKVFEVVLEGRKAELSLLFNQGKLESDQQMKSDIANAALWTRDQLTNQLMRASRGLPTMQGNSVLALAGLAYKISIESKKIKDHNQSFEDSSQYLNDKDWLLRVADTIMVVFNGNFKPKSEPMQWCQQMSSHKSTASSLIARSSATIALSLISVTLISVDLDRIQQITNSLIARIPGQEQAGTSAVMQFSCAVGLGLLANRLQQEQFTRITGDDGQKLIQKIQDTLEKTCYNEQLQNRNGVAVALGLSIAACLSNETKDPTTNGVASFKRLQKTVEEMKTTGNSSEMLERFCLSMAISAVNGFAAGCLSAEDVNKVIDVTGSIIKCNSQSSVIFSAFGILLHGTLACGLARARDIIQSNVDTWLQILTNEVEHIEDKFSAVCGLMSVFGSYRFLFQFQELDVFDPSLKNKLSVAIKTTQQVLQTSDDTKLSLQCSKLLGLLYMVNDGPVSRQTGLPSNYGYLPDFSLLRAALTYLTDSGKSGPSEIYSSSKVSCVIKSLNEASSATLPPVNWAVILSPIMKLGFDHLTRRYCLEFAIENSASSQTLQTWLLSWLSPQIFLSLEDECKEVILCNFDVISRIVPINKLKMVLEDLTVKTFQSQTDNDKLQENVLSGLKMIAVMKNPVQSSLLYVSHALENITLNLDISKDEAMLKSIGELLICLPEHLQENFNRKLQENFECSVAFDSIMVVSQERTLKVFERVLERYSVDPESFDSHSLHRIKRALQRHSLNSSSNKAAEEEIMWFHDLSGKSKKLASNKKTTALICWLDLLSSSITIWSLAGIIPAISSKSDSCIYTGACWDTFAANLAALVQLPRWQHLQDKVIDWLISILEITRQEKDRCFLDGFIQNSLISLRNCKVWKNQGIWTKSLDLVHL